MDIFLFGHGPRKGDAQVLSEPMQRWLANTEVVRCIIFTVNETDLSLLVNEIKSSSKSAELHIEFCPIQPISTETATSPSDLFGQPWEALNIMVKQVAASHQSTFFGGRGSALYDHLLWLTAQCFEKATHMNIDSAQPSLAFADENVGGEKSNQAMAGLLHFHLEDLIRGRDDDENTGFSDAARLVNYSGAGLLAGIHKALEPCLKKNMIGRTEVTEGSVTYNLLPDGLTKAAQAWWENKNKPNDFEKTLNIVFGRLPRVQSSDNHGNKYAFEEFFRFMYPLQPVDGLMTVVQRIDDDIEGTHILTLNEAIERFADSHFIGDLLHCKMVLDRRTQENRTQTSQHLVVLNPVATPDFHQEFILALLQTCLVFEQKHGLRNWMIDITKPMASLRSAVSTFSFLFNSPTSYIIKDDESVGKVSPLRVKHMAMRVPNRSAYGVLGQQRDAHGNNTGEANFLITMMLMEDLKIQPAGLLGFNPMVPETKPSGTGLTFNEVKNFARELVSEINLAKGISNSTRTTDPLVTRGLVEKVEGKPATFQLTYAGRFVATQLHHLRISEGGN